MDGPKLPAPLEAMCREHDFKLSVMERTLLKDLIVQNEGDTTEAMAYLDSWIGEALHDEEAS